MATKKQIIYWESLKGRKLSIEHKKKIGKSLKGGNKTSFKKGEHSSNKTEFKKGLIPWNKNKKGVMPVSWIKGKKHNIETIKKIKEARTKQIITEQHRKKISESHKGEKHWNWKGGITNENIKIRQSLEYIAWRNEVWRRDYWTCRICGYKGKSIVAHHIKLFSKFPELRFSVDNGLTLCRKCHLELHGGVKKIRWENKK